MKEVDPWAIIDKFRMQHSEEIKDVWMPLVAQWRDNCEQLQSRLESLERDAARYRLRLETMRALYPYLISDAELDIAIDAAMKNNP